MKSRLVACPIVIIVGVLFAFIGSNAKGSPADAQRPNVVLILTDNHGAWTLGCYGNRDIRTPNIDRLAADGTRFTQCYSVNSVCSPTRASLLTGLMPSQHGVHCYLGGGNVQVGPNAYYTLEEFRTLPEILVEFGYTAGMTGKWHLGDNLRAQDGFSHWITMPHGATATFYDAQVIEDGKIRREPQYLTDLWTDHAVQFIEESKDERFFLYLPYNGPYGLGGSLAHPARNRHAEYYADKSLPSFPRGPVHPWLVHNRQYINNPEAIRRYAAEISGVDDGVGRVMDTLERLGLDENTLVVFLADQGHSGGQNHVWGMGDHTWPLHTFDSTIHVPLIYRQPGRIPANATSDLMTSTYDVMPSLLEHVGLADEMAETPESPGRSYAAVLRGEQIPDWENVVFYEFENCRMIRTPEWKYTIRRHPAQLDELYHLTNDPGELLNLADRAEHAEIQAELAKRLEVFFNRYADPKYDLYNGGGSKSLLVTRQRSRK